MGWRELITCIYQDRANLAGVGSRPDFFPRASSEEIGNAETQLNVRLPASLRSLLLESDGVMDMMSVDGGDWFDSMWLLWSLDAIAEQNSAILDAGDGMQKCGLRRMLFFAGAGADGILFGFPITDEGVCSPSVVVWHPIANEVDEVAESLEEFLRGWLTGAISV